MIKPKITLKIPKKPTPKMLTEKRKSSYGKRKFRKNQAFTPLTSIKKGLNATQTKFIYFKKNTALNRKLNELKKRIKPMLKIRRTDNLSFFLFKGKYYAEVHSKGKIFRQLFEINNKNVIKALESFKEIKKGI